jgi:anti-sigma-K factor RskA
MDRQDEGELLSLLAGELDADATRRVRRRLAEEPELAAAWERLRGTWRQIDLPSEPLPPGFSGRVMARVRDEADGRRGVAARLALWRAPAWAQAAGAAMLACGVALGVVLGQGLAPVVLPVDAPEAPPEVTATTDLPTTPDVDGDGEDYADVYEDDYAGYLASDGDTLADAYLDALSSFAAEESS